MTEEQTNKSNTNSGGERPADIISPISDVVLPNKASAEEASRAGRFVHDKPTPENSILLLIDHQIGLMAGVRDFTALAEYKSNVVGLARIAKALKIPTLVTSSNAQWQNGDTLPEVKEISATSRSTGARASSTLTKTRHSAGRSTI